jgi:probable addiction module antidote protein
MPDLRDLDRAAEYLTAAIEEGEDVFLLAVRDVVEAQGGMSTLAKSTKLNRENLYNMLSTKGNPRLYSITAILNRLGLRLNFSAKLQGDKVA